jgi:hypothetical protein
VKKIKIMMRQTNYRNQAKTANNALLIEVEYEKDEQTINGIYLNFLQTGEFKADDIASIEPIADKCPEIGGVAVFKARELFVRIVGKHKAMWDKCGIVSNRSEEQSKAIISPSLDWSLKAYPNPANTDLRTNVSWLQRVSDWDGQGVKVAPDGVKTVVKNPAGAEIGQVINGQLIPSQYGYSGTMIGDPVNGYVTVKEGGSFSIMRKPDVSDYSPAQISILQGGIKAHTLEKHGHDIPDEALKKRATTGLAADGSVNGITSNPDFVSIPSKSTKFESAQKMQVA